MSGLRIGVTPARRDDDPSVHYIGEGCMRALSGEGAEAVMLDYPMDGKSLPALLKTLHGVLLSGGPDVHPRRYGREKTENCGQIIEERDEMELFLVDWAVKKDMPLLGICRGMQVINVALGGTLYQDLPSEKGLYHRDTESRYVHDVTFDGESPLRRMAGGDRYPVNSLHHQAAQRVGEGLLASAHAPDGMIEAVWRPASRFLLGVQWHPERSYGEDEFSRAIFREFLAACRG